MKLVVIWSTIISCHQASSTTTEWNYSEQDNWPNIEFSNPTTTVNECAGDRQSPILIPFDVAMTCSDEAASPIRFTPGNCAIQDLIFEGEPHGIKASFDLSNNKCTPPTATFPHAPNELYTVVQFHVHAKCEHYIQGEEYYYSGNTNYCDHELHIVHWNANRTNAVVVGIRMARGKDVQELKDMNTLIECWQENRAHTYAACTNGEVSSSFASCEQQNDDELFNVYGLIPTNSGFYHYEGSLTTPPCLQIVSWYLMDVKLTITSGQANSIEDLITGYIGKVNEDGICEKGVSNAAADGSTSRNSQPLNNRLVTHSCAAIDHYYFSLGTDSSSFVVGMVPLGALFAVCWILYVFRLRLLSRQSLFTMPLVAPAKLDRGH